MGHRRAFLAFGLLVSILGSPPVARAETPAVLPVIVQTAEGEHLFRAELAQTPEERARGLMFREELAIDEAMLFLFEPPQRVSFWMKNTLISLDMLFIDADGRIVAIAENTEPHSLDPHGPSVAVRAVLEINGGLSAQLGIEPGDEVRAEPLVR